MRQTWRWFGPEDNVTLSEIRQAGADGIVSALGEIGPGEIWPGETIRERRETIEAAGLSWDVVENLPVSEAIRAGAPESANHFANWIASLENLAAEGISVICYNFMPVLDWTRTDLAAPMPSGATAMRFDLIDFAAFDLFVLGRENAVLDYPDRVVAQAHKRAERLDGADRDRLARNILAGLPGAVERWSITTLRQHLGLYRGIGPERLRDNMAAILRTVVPAAERLGVRLCCHPDDPPWPLLGLPRIVSTAADLEWLVGVVPSPANGITLCTGSLGARADNDLPAMMATLGPHVHFLHLRNVRREDATIPGSLHEDEHLAGSTDMIAVLKAIRAEQTRRRAEGRKDWRIPMRPDHGQDILDDHRRASAPGYPAIGRLRGVAEVRGAMMALSHGVAP